MSAALAVFQYSNAQNDDSLTSPRVLIPSTKAVWIILSGRLSRDSLLESRCKADGNNHSSCWVFGSRFLWVPFISRMKILGPLSMIWI